MDSASLITTAFDASSTADDVVEGMDLHGRQPVVMGASSGLGVETARAANSSHRCSTTVSEWDGTGCEVWGYEGGWGRPVQGLAGAVVELGGDRGELLGGVDSQVGAFREVVAEQAVHVLVAAALPGAVRLAEEHRHAGRARKLGVRAEFLALIPGQTATQTGRQVAEHVDQRVTGGGCGPAMWQVAGGPA